MANYRNVSVSFWTDSKVVEEFTPEDRYIWLYCITNPHTNLCGCYEISIKQISAETGYNEDTVKRLLARLEKEHKVIQYDQETKELLILNWYRYNWTASERLDKPLMAGIQEVKTDRFREVLVARFNERESVMKAKMQRPGEAPVILFPMINGSEYPIYQDQCDEWAGLYPAVDVAQELRNMRGWLTSNPAKRKTSQGINKFVTGWLARVQNRGGRGGGRQPPASRSQQAMSDLQELHRYFEEGET